MTPTGKDTESGRRGLFSVTQVEKTRSQQLLSQEEISDIISVLSGYDGGVPPDVPDFFIPIVSRLQREAEELKNRQELCQKASTELDELKEEHNALMKEHESHLSDLISAHTEFDRALEIFQYHSIPMVLIGTDEHILDANDIFCSLFSVQRSDITRQFPPYRRYVPEEVPFIAPDGIRYTTISINPPIVPFDHDATSLELLIPFPEPEETGTDTELPLQVYKTALAETLLPVAIVDQYNTIQFANTAFLDILGREESNVYLRDIASCGLAPEISEKITSCRLSGDLEYQTEVTQLDNAIINIWVKIFSIIHEEENFSLVVIIPDEEIPLSDETPVHEPVSPPDTGLLKTLIDLNPSPIVILNFSEQIIFANEGLSELIGVSSGELTGQKLPDIGITIPDLSSYNEEIEVIPEEICIESPYGMQCYSGLLITYQSGTGNNFIVILQPPLEQIEAGLQANLEPEIPESVFTPSAETGDVLRDEEPALTVDPGVREVTDLLQVPIPAVKREGPAITSINEAFQSWTGVTDPALQDFSHILISNITQSVGNPPKVFSSVFPEGMKTYRIVNQPEENLDNAGISLFIDLTECYETIAGLTNQLDDARQTLAMKREDLTIETDQTPSPDISGQIDIVEFELAGGRYAMDIGMVREVVEMLPITPLPKTPPYVIGIINLRGEVTHVIDLGIILGERKKQDRTGQKIIIVPPDAAHGEHLGIIVDNVRSVTEIANRQVTALGEDINTKIQTRIKGVIKVKHDDMIDKRDEEEKDGHLVIWLDMKDILGKLAGFHS